MKMIKRKICKKGYMLGYWKGERVALIPQFHPNANPGEYVIEEVEVPTDYPVPRIIDPNETPISEIKEICEFNNLPFSWITGIKLKDRQATKITADTLIQEAIEYFVAFGTAGTTTAQYRRIFDELIREGIIDPKVSIDFYLQGIDAVQASALNFSPLEKRGSEHYNYNDKIYNMLKSFHGYLQNLNSLGMKKTRKGNQFYRAKRKNHLTEEEAPVLFSALKDINPIHALIARILWWFNREISDHPDAPVIHLESVLLMQPSDIGPDLFEDTRGTLPENVGGNSVRVRSRAFPGSKMICYYVPGKMYAELSELARNTDHFLFRNKSGAPIDARLVRRSFNEACKKANLRNITPSYVR